MVYVPGTEERDPKKQNVSLQELGRAAESLESDVAANTAAIAAIAPATPKAWAYVTVSAGAYTLAAGSGISGIVKNSTGNVTVTFSTAFSSANYNCVVGANNNVRTWTVVSRTTTTVNLVTTDDAAGFDLVAFGGQ